MFSLGIRYLNGFSVAAEPDSYERAEWPPHPGRVFMALAAAHFVTGGDPAERAALEWLEALEDAPAIRAGEHHERAVVIQYVPVDDKAGPAKALLQSLPLTRDRQPRTFAHAALDDDLVYLSWPGAEPPARVLGALETLCSKVTRIGHSSSLVQMWIADEDEAGEPNWVPDDSRSALHLRTAGPGTLADLERLYDETAVETYASLKAAAEDDTDKKAQRAAKKQLKHEFGNRPPQQLRPRLSIYQGYARPATRGEDGAASGTVFNPHPLVLMLERDEPVRRELDLPCTLAVVQRLRDAVLSHSNGLPDRIRSLLSGHEPDGTPLDAPHLAFLPLAFVGHPHADGRLLGVGLVFPADTAREERRLALQAVARVRHLALGRLGRWRIAGERRSSPPWNLRPEAWTAFPRGATHWSTVTPVVFDRHPKNKERAAYEREVAAMIAGGCMRIGLPRPREVIVTQISAHPGVPPAFEFPRLRRKDGSERRHTHAILVFDRPVCGPVLIGAGRYRGYGVGRAIQAAPQPHSSG